MSKARTLANLISDNAELADGQISVAEVVGAAPTASPTFTGTTTVNGTTNLAGTTNDGSTLTQITQSGTGRAMSVNRNVASATRAMVNLVQSHSSGGTEAVLDVQQTLSSSRAIRVTADGSTDRFSVYGTGALVTNPPAGGHAVFNEGGVDVDFRVESNNNANMLFVDGGNNNVGIGKAPGSGQGALQIAPQVASTNYYRPAGNYAVFGDTGGDGEQDWVYLAGSYTDTDKSVGFAMQDYNGNFGQYAGSYIRANQAKVRIGHFVGGANSGTAPSLADNFIFDTAGGAVFNERGSTGDFRVESDNNSAMLVVEAAGDQVRMGNSSASTPSSVASLVARNGVTTDYTGGHTMSYQAGTYTDYYKGMTGINLSTASGRGLHIFNYDNDSDGGVNIWSGRPTVGTPIPLASFNGSSGTVFNPDRGGVIDFRIASGANNHMLFVDAGVNQVVVGSSSTTTNHALRINGSVGAFGGNVADTSSGSSRTLDIPFSQLGGRGTYLATYFSFSNGGAQQNGFVCMVQVMTSPERASGVVISDRYTTVTSITHSGSNLRIVFTADGSFTHNDGTIGLIRLA